MKYLNLIALLLTTTILAGQGNNITAEMLNEWTFYGEGSKKTQTGMFFMREANKSGGVAIVSPNPYGENVVVKYEVMTLTPATVCIAILSASNIGEDEKLSIPDDYDGSMKYWVDNAENYFVAFRNGPHNRTPFIRKYPAENGADPALAVHNKNLMHSGIFHKVEIGKEGEKIWLKIDGKTILKTTDRESYGGGHIAFRIRGTAGEYASCLMRNLEIEETELK